MPAKVKVLTVVGARPQFIKAWPVSRALAEAGVEETLIHTGQHYDDRMSAIFFDELQLRVPDENLDIGSGTHAEQTARMLVALERAMMGRNPRWVLVYGDTNTTLAGALAACKLGVPIAHVEAGLRSYNRAMPEEHNRVLTDHCSTLLLCPTKTSMANLAREGLGAGSHLVGDVMYDAVLHFAGVAAERSTIRADLELEERGYLLATVHRAYNTDDPAALARLVRALDSIGEPVVFPVHPRTRTRLAALGDAALLSPRNVRLVEPVGYLDMLSLEQGARVILTDSGGVQKEAFFMGVPCVTMRPETEWVETVASGWNVLAGSDVAAIVKAAREAVPPGGRPPALFGDGQAARAIASLVKAAP